LDNLFNPWKQNTNTSFMSILKYIYRLKQMDDLIKRKATGTPDEFAIKLGICKSMLMLNINELKTLGAPVKYCNQIRSYYYDEQGHLEVKFKSIDSMHAIKGGFYSPKDLLGFVFKQQNPA
jgi:hypothetical protein